MSTAAARLTYVWLALCILTAVSWLFGHGDVGPQVGVSVPVTVAVLAIGFVKARLVIQHFMEVRTAPRWLRLATDGWLVTLWGTVLALYLHSAAILS